MFACTRWLAAALTCASALGCGGGASAPDAGPVDGGPVDAAIDAAIDAAPRPGRVCDLAIALQPGDEIASRTTGVAEVTDPAGASCAGGTESAPQMYFVVPTGATPGDLVVDVIVDETAPVPFDAVISARAECLDDRTELGCADSALGEHLEVLGAAGDVFLIVDGSAQLGGAPAGAFTLRTRPRKIRAQGEPCDPDEEASRCDAGLRCVAGACAPDSAEVACGVAEDLTAALASGPVERARLTRPYAADFFRGACVFDPDAGAPEHVYRIDVAQPSDLEATTDFPDTRFDTALYLRAGDCDGAEIACADDIDADAGNFKSRLTAQGLPPGTYFLVVDGASAPGTGAYRLRVSLTPG